MAVFIRYRRLTKRFLIGLLFAISLLVSPMLRQIDFLLSSAAIAQAQSADQWMQQGVDYYQIGSFSAAITNWETALSLYRADSNLEKVAIVLENLARGYQALGQSDQELEYWQQATSAYLQIGNRLRVGRMLAEQAQAYSRLGQYGKAITLLCATPEEQRCREDSALSMIQALPNRDRVGEIVVLGSLGDAHRLQGKADRAVFYLEQGLAIAEELQDPAYLISTLNSLGNAYLSLAQLNERRALSARQIEEAQDAAAYESTAQTQNAKALRFLQTSFSLAQATHDQTSQVRALVGALPAYYRANAEEIKTPLQQAILLVETLPNSAEKVYASIDLARFIQLTASSSPLVLGQQCTSQVIEPQAESILQQAVAAAEDISDWRSKSFALGELGHLYECQLDYEQALALTRQAQLAADQTLQGKDSLYLWQWQMGRILKAQGKAAEAIRAYEESLATLESLRKDILTASRTVQFDFRETVEPVYRELVELRLQQEQPAVLMQSESTEVSADNLSLALNTLDNLKLAELQNYFGNDCVLTSLNPTNTSLAKIAARSAIFSTVLLRDRVAVILTIPTQSPEGKPRALRQFEWIQNEAEKDIAPAMLVETVNEYRKGLERIRDAVPGAPLGGYDSRLAEQLYNWMIRPFEPLLQQNQIQTLVFVQDGIFRSVPMSALYDGEKFLIDRYAIAVTPSLNLTNLEATNRQQFRALAVGLTQSATVDGTSFAALRYVASELQAVQAILPRSLELRDQEFTFDRFQQALKDRTYPVIHIATHGKFSAESDNAFLITGASPTSPNQKLTVNRLDDLIRQTTVRNPLELLVLSACQTATGDDRAALGLAGVAAQAGAKRVLASLWSINDQATTELITQFYQGLTDLELTQAQALQFAQRALLTNERTAHPAFWSAFILIGNWL